MSQDEIYEAVCEIVDDFLAGGVEYIAIAEFVGEEFEGEDADIEAVDLGVRVMLNDLLSYRNEYL